MKRLNSKILFSIITVSIVILDQLSKWLIEHFRPQWNLVILDLNYVQNTGAGFGLLPGHTLILTLVSLAVALAIIIFYHRLPKDQSAQILSAVFLGGVVGNLLDRLLRGYVVDFIDLRFWPAFNFADACLSLAGLGLIIYFWRK